MLLASLITVIVLSALGNLPRSGSNFLLSSLQVIVSSLCTSVISSFGAQYQTVVQSAHFARIFDTLSWPIDIRAVIKDFNLEPELVTHACCKKCFYLYAPTTVEGKAQYPSHCTFRKTPHSRCCNTPLVRPSRTAGGMESQVPIQAFKYQTMVSWLGRLLSRPGIEKSMEETTSNQSVSTIPPCLTTLRNLWDRT